MALPPFFTSDKDFVLIAFTQRRDHSWGAAGRRIEPRTFYERHRLNMELDLQSLFGLLCTDVLIG